MIPLQVQSIFNFIDFLDQNKKEFIEKYLPLCDEIENLVNERNTLNINKNYREKQRYDILQAQIKPKFDLVFSNIYGTVVAKLRELGIWSGDQSYTSIKNNISSAFSIFKTTFHEADIPQVILYKDKYLNFRKETNSNFLTLQLVFSDLDESLKELFDYFNDTEDNDFESLEVNTINCSTFEEAIILYQKNPKKNIRFSVPFMAASPGTVQNVSNRVVNLDSQDFFAFINDIRDSLNSGIKSTRNSYEEALHRVTILKQIIEDKGGSRLFANPANQNEAFFQQLFKFTFEGSDFDINAEVNNGRGSVDFIVSRGPTDKTIIEFKLAKNSKISQNLKNQVEVYKKANGTENAVIAILYFNSEEHNRIEKLIGKLGLNTQENIILIDGQTKVSASNVR